MAKSARKVSVKVMYNDQIDSDLDRKIENIMKRIGCKWYAQGYNHTSGFRDICFDLEIPKEGAHGKISEKSTKRN